MERDAFLGLLIFVFVMALAVFEVASRDRLVEPVSIATPE